MNRTVHVRIICRHIGFFVIFFKKRLYSRMFYVKIK